MLKATNGGTDRLYEARCAPSHSNWMKEWFRKKEQLDRNSRCRKTFSLSANGEKPKGPMTERMRPPLSRHGYSYLEIHIVSSFEVYPVISFRVLIVSPDRPSRYQVENLLAVSEWTWSLHNTPHHSHPSSAKSRSRLWIPLNRSLVCDCARLCQLHLFMENIVSIVSKRSPSSIMRNTSIEQIALCRPPLRVPLKLSFGIFHCFAEPTPLHNRFTVDALRLW